MTRIEKIQSATVAIEDARKSRDELKSEIARLEDALHFVEADIRHQGDILDDAFGD